MPALMLPFPESRLQTAPLAMPFFNQLPPALQEAARKHWYLYRYLAALPIEEIGIPLYFPKLSRKLEKLRVRNLIYPIEDNLFVHIYPDLRSERDYWIPIEPTLVVKLNGLVEQLDMKLLDMAEEIGKAPAEERRQVLLSAVEKICTTNTMTRNGHLVVSPQELDTLKYIAVRDKLGTGVIHPLLQDPYIEDISCSGIGPIFIEHKIFKSLKTAITFETMDELDDFVVRLGERIRRPVTLRHPIVDAVLPDGSRINIVYGRDIAKRGSNFTIRKFSKSPLSILKLVDFGSLNYLIAAYMWLVIENGLNVFVSGATASGKTTLLNALTTFIKPDAKIVSIEDTPELQVPHANWVREVVRDMGGDKKGSAVDMFDLLRAALRQRPDRILIGEIRGVEGNIAFQAMQTGHGVMATFHASSVEKLIQRLTGDPIRVPKPYIDNLDVVIIQAAVRAPDGRTVRRVVSVNEIVDYDPSSETFSFVTTFRWRPDDDVFEFPGHMNSYVLEQKVAMKRGIPPSKKRLIYSELNRRAAILEKLHKRSKIDGFDELFRVLAEAYKQGLV